VVINNTLLCEIFHDASVKEWFVDRVYD
jgi:hypothetical protein